MKIDDWFTKPGSGRNRKAADPMKRAVTVFRIPPTDAELWPDGCGGSVGDWRGGELVVRKSYAFLEPFVYIKTIN